MLKYSLSLKLMPPILIGGMLIVAAMDYFIYKGTEQAVERYVQMQAFQHIESFLIATETSSRKADLIRITNSLSTYEDIKEMFIIDNDKGSIIASNKNRFLGKSVDALPNHYPDNIVKKVSVTGQKYYQKLEKNKYLVGFRSHMFSQDRTSRKSITILVLASTEKIRLFFSHFEEQLFLQSIFVFILAIVIFFSLLKLLLINPIKKMVKTLTEAKQTQIPILCEVNSDDELAILASTYNEILLDRFEKNKALTTANKELKALSQNDPLTGISNRRNFDRILHKEWLRATRKHEAISLIMLDIDYFKQFNDTHGHLAGDDCLILVAKTLDSSIKRPGDIACRYGGEEFAIILPQSNPQSWEFAENCRQKIEELIIFKDSNNQAVKVTMSLGIATTIPQKGQDSDLLIKAADMALYQAKAAGRNTVIVHDMAHAETQAFRKADNVMLFQKPKKST